MTDWQLAKKMDMFGLSVAHYRTEIEKYPKVRISIFGSDSKYRWCQTELGNKWIWSAPTQTDYVDMYFLHEDDAIIFKLKFSSVDTTLRV